MQFAFATTSGEKRLSKNVGAGTNTPAALQHKTYHFSIVIPHLFM